MAGTYGRNFGFRLSDESLRSADGRYRTPKGAAGVLRQGSLVKIDFANKPYVKVASDATGAPGTVGLLLQEHKGDWSIYSTSVPTTDTFGVTLADTQCVITYGAGVKVWFKNTPARTGQDGHGRDAQTMFVGTGTGALVEGELVGWDGTHYVHTTDAAAAIGVCVSLNVDTDGHGSAEIILSK